MAMAELHVVGALRNKRAELAGVVSQLEKQLAQKRLNLTHLDATMRLFDPQVRPNEIRPKQQRERSAWFRPGECLRLTYDELRDATEPMTTRELAERIMRVKAMPTIVAVSWFRRRCSVRSTEPRRRSFASRSRASSAGGWARRRGQIASSRRNQPMACTAWPPNDAIRLLAVADAGQVLTPSRLLA
jgi:hypothetical protein